MFRRIGGAASAALLTAFALLASNVSATDRAYSYGGFSYLNSDGLDGWAGEGSFEVGGNFRIAGGGSYVESEGLDLRTLNLGVGYIARLSPAADLVFDVGGFNIENQFLFTRANDDIWGAFGSVTLRIAAGEHFDIEPAVSYTRLIDDRFDGDDFVYGLTGRVWLGNRFAFEIGIADSADAPDPTFSVGMRFGRRKR